MALAESGWHRARCAEPQKQDDYCNKNSLSATLSNYLSLPHYLYVVIAVLPVATKCIGSKIINGPLTEGTTVHERRSYIPNSTTT